MTKAIPQDILDVLSKSICEGHHLHLPGTLDRKTYTRVADVLGMLGGTWNKKFRAHVFNDDCADIVAAAVMTQEVTDFKKLYQFFETPDDLATQVVQAAQIQRDHLVLEPSAGRGSLIRAMQREFPGKLASVCELDTQHHTALKAIGSVLMGSDFLKVEPVAGFDRIIANPPFRFGQDVDHLMHMEKFLNSKGRLVCITSPAWQYRADSRHNNFRQWLRKRKHEVEEIPAGAFKASGTEIHTLMVTIQN